MCMPGACRGQKKLLDGGELESQMVVNHRAMLGTAPRRSPARPLSISPAQPLSFYFLSPAKLNLCRSGTHRHVAITGVWFTYQESVTTDSASPRSRHSSTMSPSPSHARMLTGSVMRKSCAGNHSAKSSCVRPSCHSQKTLSSLFLPDLRSYGLFPPPLSQ